jgi:hypothetical protein
MITVLISFTAARKIKSPNPKGVGDFIILDPDIICIYLTYVYSEKVS